jgi:hypothetical protein
VYRTVEQVGYGRRVMVLNFRVPRRAGALFLADPVRLGAKRGEFPVIPESPSGRRRTPLFYEAGGTVVSLTWLTNTDYRYTQAVPLGRDRHRYPAVRLSEPYRRKLLAQHVPGLETWGLDLLLRLARQSVPRDEQFIAALEHRRAPGSYLPPVYWERVARMLNDHLSRSGEYTWSLELRRESMEMDPVLDFLVHVKQGHCERYASALTLLLRTQGIPARIVKGHRGADYQGDGTYLVRNSHAHAWVEALIPSAPAERASGRLGPSGANDADGGSGGDWLVLDPTPDSTLDEPSALERLQRGSKILWQDLILGYNSANQADLWDELLSGRLLLSAAPWLGSGMLLSVVVWLLRRRRSDNRGRLGPSGSLYAKLCKLLHRYARLQPQGDETPGELAARAEQFLASRPATAEVADVPARVVSIYYSMRYGNQTPQPAVLLEVSGRLDALATALRRA